MQHRIKENVSWLIDHDDRTQRNVTEAARGIGLPQSTLMRIASGETDSPRIDNLISIAKFFRVSISQLIGEFPLPGKDMMAQEDNGQYQVITNPHPAKYEIDAVYLGKAIDLLKEDVADWCEKPTPNQSRLLMMYYDKIQQDMH